MHTFLDAVVDHYGPIDREKREKLAELRGIPQKSFKPHRIAWNGIEYLIPVRSPTGHIQDLGRYSGSGKVKATRKGLGPGTGLYNADKLVEASPDVRVYVCAGFWDVVALETILRTAGKPGVVVGVPGEGVFKREWIGLFSGRDVTLCYDNDEAGDKGMAKVGGCTGYPNIASKLNEGLLRGVAKRIRYTCWPISLSKSVDINDLWKQEGKAGWKLLKQMVGDYHRRDIALTEQKGTKKRKRKKGKKVARVGFEQIRSAYGQWLRMTPDMTAALRLVFAVSGTTVLHDDPIWLYLVGPSGCGKTALLSSLRNSDRCVYRSSLSKAALVSGIRGTDPSLIPELDGKCFITKDFTEVLQTNEAERREILAVLRGVFDGYIDKSYGTGVFRSYESHFNFIAGVTPIIHRYTDQGAALGDRFLKFDMGKGRALAQPRQLMAALDGLELKQKQDSDLADIAEAYIEQLYELAEKRMAKFETPRWLKDKLILMGEFISLIRTNVEKDYHGELVYRPESEMPTRMVKQLAKLAAGLCLIDGKEMPDRKIYSEILTVAMDTATGFRREVVETLLNGQKRGMTVSEIEGILKLPVSTLRDRLHELYVLRLVERRKKKRKSKGNGMELGPRPDYWRLSGRLRELWNELQQGVE